MESDKEHCLLFVFYQKRSVADAHKIIYETYNENVIVIRTCANWFKWFKKRWFQYQWQRTLCSCRKGQIVERWKKRKQWKIFRLIYIDFFIVYKIIKKLQKIGKNFCTDLITPREEDSLLMDLVNLIKSINDVAPLELRR